MQPWMLDAVAGRDELEEPWVAVVEDETVFEVAKPVVFSPFRSIHQGQFPTSILSRHAAPSGMPHFEKGYVGHCSASLESGLEA